MMVIGCPECGKHGTKCDCAKAVQDVTALQPLVRDPERTIRKHAMRTIDLIIDRLQTRRAELEQHAVDRATGQGAREYGTSAWSKTPDALLDELDDELADALFYGGARFDVIDAEPLPASDVINVGMVFS